MKGTAVSRRRRGVCRVASFFAVAALLTVAAGCGKPGHGAETDSVKAADVEQLDGLLSQELTLVDAYSRNLPLLRGPALAVAAGFRGQGQAHVDALTKAIRGLGGETEAAASKAGSPPPQDPGGALRLFYEVENAALALALEAAPRLETAAPRTLAAALAASHAQHLAILRQAMGAGLAASAPEPFESGEEPPPTPAGEPETSR